MLQEENTKQLPRCSSAPGRQELSEKPQRSTSYLHVLTVDALESGHSAEETGNKCERVRCTSPEDEVSFIFNLGLVVGKLDSAIHRIDIFQLFDF